VTALRRRGERLSPDDRWPTLTGHIVGLTLAVVGVGVFTAGAVDVVDGGPDVGMLLLSGLVMTLIGTVLWRSTITPGSIRVLDVFTGVTVTWVVIAFAGAIPYLLTGHFGRIDDLGLLPSGQHRILNVPDPVHVIGAGGDPQ